MLQIHMKLLLPFDSPFFSLTALNVRLLINHLFLTSVKEPDDSLLKVKFYPIKVK